MLTEVVNSDQQTFSCRTADIAKMSPLNPYSESDKYEIASASDVISKGDCVDHGENNLRQRKSDSQKMCETEIKLCENSSTSSYRSSIKPDSGLSQSKNDLPDSKYCNHNQIHDKPCENSENANESVPKLRLYKKRPEDNLLPNSSIRTALLDLSPTWVKSFIQDPEYVMNEEKSKSQEVHRHADSLFSTSSGFTNYRGLLNLCIILLVLSNARLFLENIIKYGILIEPLMWIKIFLDQPNSPSILCLIVGANVFILAMYGTEKFLSKSLLSERLAFMLESVILILLLVIPAGVILLDHPNPLISTTVLGMYTVAFLKLVSYASVNQWCRQANSPRTRIKRSKSVSVSGTNAAMDSTQTEDIITYPQNLTLKDLYYFMLAPTLCYELNFPRSLRIRKRFLLKRFIEMLFIIQLILGCIQQWILPLVNNSLKPLADMDAMRCMERLLKLAVPNHFIWLMFFYWFFHSTLNVLAELLTFGDREFYKDWWNSDTVSAFWSNWNIPVHRWASRHLYKPLMKRGYSKMTGSVAVFFVSAFFHEYLLSVPLRMFRLWAFMGMLGQVPLALVQSKYIHGKYGNMVVWLSLILGQPIAILAYFHDYYVTQIATVSTT